MPVRIESLRVNRGGPLKEDFSFQPGDLNLVYGPNESGKTFIVEALISFLFKSGKRSDWELRDWSPSGKAILSGIEEKPVDFTKSKAKLDDLWLAGSGLPTELSRMLVVRAGDTALTEGNGGVGPSILKTFLSGEQTLDSVEKRVVKSLREATVEHGVIQAKLTGDKRTRDELRAELDSLDQLNDLLDRDLDRGAIHSMEKRRDLLETERRSLDRARRHSAFQLRQELMAIRDREGDLPGEKEISEAKRVAWSRSEKQKELERRSGELNGLLPSEDESRWVRHAAEVYSSAASRQEKSGGRPLFLYLTILLLAATATTGLLGMPVPLVICAAGSIIALFLHHRTATPSQEELADSRELAAIRDDFENRYEKPLSSIADLNAKAEELRDRKVLTTETRRQVDDLEGVVAALDAQMVGFFRQHGMGDHPPENWIEVLSGIESTRGTLDKECNDIEMKLARLGVEPDDVPPEASPVPWDPERYRSLSEELGELTRELQEKKGLENSLKSNLANRTGLEVTASWEDLRTALQDLRDRKAEEYRAVTSRILAQIAVMDAVRSFRVLERERIEQGLASPDITAPLREITGVYTGLSQGDDGELILSTDQGDSYPLDQLSTGAMEQVHLSLRTSFARSALDDTAFLVLDDAFQHSDWHRRERMVAYTLGLVHSGWQVFYFTMDDHMKEIFERSGKALGDRFLSVSIG